MAMERTELTPCDVEMAPLSVPIRILVVEDDPLVRFNIAEALRLIGVGVMEAATADEAWAFLATGARVDLVFTDHRMPGTMTGAQLAGRISQNYPALSVVLTSTHLDARQWHGPFLRKPYDLMDTATALETQARATRSTP
jgi:CheY-like chemotaxis protein